jgi:hypothetical protein
LQVHAEQWVKRVSVVVGPWQLYST